MGIDAASSTSSTVSSTAQVSSASNSDNAKKTSTDSSFKDEMSKVSSKEEKDTKSHENVETEKTQDTLDKFDNNQQKDENDEFQNLSGAIDYTKFGAMELNNANTMLQNNIREMMNTTSQIPEVNGLQATGSIFSFGLAGEGKNQVSLTQDDAQFFINLTQENDISSQNINALAQNMIANGADAAEVSKNAKISQTLLNAINTAKENNQPLRIDFDQNISVILRIGQDGALSARFIPGDKAVEQYLRNNIETLKATFNENDLPYSELSYSNSSKQQNEKRRNKQQQGEQ